MYGWSKKSIIGKGKLVKKETNGVEREEEKLACMNFGTKNDL